MSLCICIILLIISLNYWENSPGMLFAQVKCFFLFCIVASSEEESDYTLSNFSFVVVHYCWRNTIIGAIIGKRFQFCVQEIATVWMSSFDYVSPNQKLEKEHAIIGIVPEIQTILFNYFCSHLFVFFSTIVYTIPSLDGCAVTWRASKVLQMVSKDHHGILNSLLPV